MCWRHRLLQHQDLVKGNGEGLVQRPAVCDPEAATGDIGFGIERSPGKELDLDGVSLKD